MSKAFANNDSEDEDIELERVPVLPPGTRNYITPAGAARLEAERKKIFLEKQTLSKETVEDQARLKRLDRRLEGITERLNTALVIDPLKQPPDRVLFGASVTLRDEKGGEQTWRIVGLDEVDLSKGWISWLSPLAKLLLEKKVGEGVSLGQHPSHVLRIRYLAD